MASGIPNKIQVSKPPTGQTMGEKLYLVFKSGRWAAHQTMSIVTCLKSVPELNDGRVDRMNSFGADLIPPSSADGW
jgi:hypothetical protein